MPGYVGRFAPSPTGPLHAGSLVAALASWLDARAWNQGVGGRWLLRIEDLDTPRCVPGAAERMLRQLADCSLLPDAAPQYQSQRLALYAQARDRLITAGMAYPCGCSRKDIDLTLQGLGLTRARHQDRVYPGTCRDGLRGKQAVAWRFRTDRSDLHDCSGIRQADDAMAPRVHHACVDWSDRRLGPQTQDVAVAVGDFVLQRADGPFAYQLAVVVDDAEQGISDVVRGEDLCDNTARQILLQHALGLATPRYLHTPLALAADGQKLSKQNGATALDTSQPLVVLQRAAATLGLPAHGGPAGDALQAWVGAWRDLYNPQPVTVSPESPRATPPSTGSAPADVAHPKAIRSFVLRAGRTTAGQSRAMEQLGPQFLIPYQPSIDALGQIYPQLARRTAQPVADAATHAPEQHNRPLVLEIGFGMGEASAHIATVLPGTDFVCCEVHQPGVGALLKRIGDLGLSNIRILAHDAVEVIDNMLAPWSPTRPAIGLDGVHIFFPDPWHKTRHNKRRLIQSGLVQRLASRLKPGGYLHCATDWEPYAQQILEVLSQEPLLGNRQLASHPELAGYAPRPQYRPLTKFEQRGLRLGHGVWDLVFHRV